MIASCGVSGTALSDKIIIVCVIEDGEAQEVKRRVDIEAAAMTTEDLQLRLKLQHAERTSPQSSESTTDNSR